FFLWKVVDLLDFRLLGSIMGEFLSLGAVTVVIIFAPEIRNFVASLGNNGLIERLIRPGTATSVSDRTRQEIVEALKTLRASGAGALIVLTKDNPLTEISETGDELDSQIHARLIVSIFHKESPLHDGAMIVSKGRIQAVRSILPISKSDNLDPELGLRHRAALGVSEMSDALVLVVSEERREVSLALQGELRRNVDYSELEEALTAHIGKIL
ncbi:MAG: diadenylate cyclase, partial [Bacteroidota bacterium]